MQALDSDDAAPSVTTAEGVGVSEADEMAEWMVLESSPQELATKPRYLEH